LREENELAREKKRKKMSDGVTRCAEFAGFVDASTIKKQNTHKNKWRGQNAAEEKKSASHFYHFVFCCCCLVVLCCCWGGNHRISWEKKRFYRAHAAKQKNVE